MAKKTAAGKPKAKKAVRKAARKVARPPKVKVSFKRLHAEMDAALAALQGRERGFKRDLLIRKLTIMRKAHLCPDTGMFVELD